MFSVRRGDGPPNGIGRTASIGGCRRAAAALLGLLLPHRCHECGQGLPPPGAGRFPSYPRQASEHAQMAQRLESLLCPDCIRNVRPVGSPLCTHCGKPFDTPVGTDHVCADCITAPKPFTCARAAGIYEGALRSLIRAFKFNGRTRHARPLGELAFDALARYWTPMGIELVLPVPLHPRRMRRRGFNQVWLMMRHWPDQYRKTFGRDSGVAICRNTLIRHRPTPPQTGLDQHHRRRNIKNAFSVIDADKVAGKHVLLVDDVYTTGATVAECARVLLTAGARQVDVLTLARTVKGRLTSGAKGREHNDD